MISHAKTSQEGTRVRSRPAIALGLASLLLSLVGCTPEPPQIYQPPPPEESGIQPRTAIDPESEARVRAALFGPEPPVAGLVLDESASGWTDDVVSRVCDTRQGDGAYLSWYGQARLWKTDGLSVESFAGAFGRPTAAEAVEQVKSRFSCTEYTADANPNARVDIPAPDSDGWHRDIRRIEPPTLTGVENAVFFCESVKDVNKRCYAALARKDVVSRLTVTAVTTERAEQVARSLLDEAAVRLVAATP